MRRMEKNEIVRRFLERGILLDPDAIDDLSQLAEAELQKLIDSLAEMSVEVASKKEIEATLRGGVKHAAPRLRVLQATLTSPSDSRPDYLRFFQGRYDRIAGLIKRKAGYGEPISIVQARSAGGAFTGVVMVSDKKRTRQGHLGLVLEDPTGRLKAVVPKGSPVFAEAAKLVLDQVVGVKGEYDRRNKLLVVKDLTLPDLEEQEGPLSEAGLYAVFISDLHFGAKDFMEGAFSNFLSWTRGEFGTAEEREVARRAGFVSIAGDLVDSTGEPGKLYSELCERLRVIPERIQILAIPGECDAARIPDPQPPFTEEALKALKSLKNLTAAASPCRCEMNDVPVLAYHGRSVADWMQSMGTENPCDSIQHMLASRLFAPVYGGSVPVLPSTPDPFFISEVPRIVHMGHTHRACHTRYRGVLLLSTASWLERDIGNGSGKAFVVDLSTLETTVIDFGR